MLLLDLQEQHARPPRGLPRPDDFFAFNDFRSTHSYVTGFPVVPKPGDPTGIPGAGQLAAGIVVPPELMSGVSGVQVSINARTNQNILVRVLCGAYNNAQITFPVDIVIVAWDGRAPGVPPFGTYNAPVLVPAGTAMEWSVARRFDCLIREPGPINSFATVEFIDTLRRDVRFTARIPITISNPQDVRRAVPGRLGCRPGPPGSTAAPRILPPANRFPIANPWNG